MFKADKTLDNTPNANQWSASIEDFRLAWDYYKVNLNERARINDYFFKTTAIPGAILSSFPLIGPRLTESFAFISSPLFGLASGFIILALGFAGTSLYILHCYEEAVSKDYLRFLNTTRKNITEKYPELAGYYKLDANMTRRSIGGMPASFWRTLTMNIISSLLLTLSMYLIIYNSVRLTWRFDPLDESLPMTVSLLCAVLYIVFLKIHISLRAHLLPQQGT